MMADPAEPKREPEVQKHVYLREKMHKYYRVLQIAIFIIFGIPALIVRVMSWVAR